MPDKPQSHLLVVDDEPLNRELLRRMLQAKYQISEVDCAMGALEFLERDPSVSMILCDHIMPGTTGAELAFLVNKRWPELPFLLLTGCDDHEEVQEAHQAGVVGDVLSKPWRSRELREMIAGHLPQVS